MLTMKSILLFIHISAGFIALCSALLAILFRVVNAKHSWHVYAGRSFVFSMLVISLTAIPIAMITRNLFLFLIAIFSGYLAHAGWRYATNRSGKPRLVDWLSVGTMIVTAGIMAITGIVLLLQKDQQGVILIAFALIAFGNSVKDFSIVRNGGITGNERIAMHLTMMLGATIATVTAFVVTNFSMQPEFILWLLPSLVITPVIIIWNRKLLKK